MPIVVHLGERKIGIIPSWMYSKFLRIKGQHNRNEMDESIHTQDSAEKKVRRSSTAIRLLQHRIGSAIVTVIVIAYLTILGLLLAERGREHLPAQPVDAMWQSGINLVDYFTRHPETYYWNRQTIPAFGLLSGILAKSVGLLLCSMGLALGIGVLFGISAASSKRKLLSALVLSLSVLGISTPSFLLAMFLWVINIFVHRTFGIEVLPSAGFGWDAHLVMPALVLAMRPMAQIAQVTYISLRDVMRQDYIRTAHAKGLAWRDVRNRHALRNILIPIFTTLGTSLRYSLASLIIVELFFEWPGIGLTLFEAIGRGEIFLIVDLILSLGLFFLIVNLVLEVLFPLLDARIADQNRDESLEEEDSFGRWWGKVFEMFRAWMRDARKDRQVHQKSELAPLPLATRKHVETTDEIGPQTNWSWILRNFITNPSLILGSFMIIALIGLVFFGPALTSANPYQTNGVMLINDEIFAPPFKPSSVFPWGSDYVGRDIQALVLYGARQTLTLAFLGMLARLALGVFLGALAGWSQRGWLDRLVTGAIGVWAAFPVTLFAMILIQALGIQQGMWVFVFTVCIVGWGEIAQFVRSQVITLKPQMYVESARSVGLRSDQIMIRHIVPNLMNGLITLAVLEMGGVLMLLAELGYLNIFLGGGFRVMIGEVGRMVPVVVFFSDVPEWAALIANVRQYWRSYPWMALYPGLAVFLSVIAFNLLGEGLRRFLDDTYSNTSRWFNRYTLVIAVGLALIVALILGSSAPLSLYRPEGLKFDEKQVMQDIENLSSAEMQGRETGTPGATAAANYIADRMSEIGIFPAGESHSYLQHLVQPRDHLLETPTLSILDDAGQPIQQLTYKHDFTEIGVLAGSSGDAQAQIMGVAFGSTRDPALTDEYGLSQSAAKDHIVIVHIADVEKVNAQPVKGILAISDDIFTMDRRDLKPYKLIPVEQLRPYMLISAEVADILLKTAGSNLAELSAARETLKPGQMKLTEEGSPVSMSLRPRRADNFLDERYINVLGVIPGQGHFMGTENQVIIVSAYYDGLGTDLTGTVYPGANDNASGVAMMLELARLMKESAYQPEKTVLFVAWAGGERQEGLSVVEVLKARTGTRELTAEAVIELSGVGYGTGNSITLGNDSSYRLIKLFQTAASRYDLQTTTRGRNPHYGVPLPTAFGGRDAMTLSISWDGSDSLAHTPKDMVTIIDPSKLYDTGSTTALVLFVLSRETNY